MLSTTVLTALVIFFTDRLEILNDIFGGFLDKRKKVGPVSVLGRER